MTDIECYRSESTWAALLAALPNVKPDPATGKLEPHCFVEVLGEVGNIWPASVLDDPARGYMPGRANLKSRC